MVVRRFFASYRSAPAQTGPTFSRSEGATGLQSVASGHCERHESRRRLGGFAQYWVRELRRRPRALLPPFRIRARLNSSLRKAPPSSRDDGIQAGRQLLLRRSDTRYRANRAVRLMPLKRLLLDQLPRTSSSGHLVRCAPKHVFCPIKGLSMSEPFTIAKLKTRPIMGTWSVEGNTQEFPGFLYLEDDNLHLTLYFTIGGHTSFEILERSDPNLMSFAPPNQPTLHGRTKAAGHVTLFHCSQLNYRALNQLDPPQTRLELTLRPTQAWFGDGFVSAEQKYQDLSFSAPGLLSQQYTSTIDFSLNRHLSARAIPTN